jgi:tetratricopeptide (TPR) repeat protein
VVLRLGGRLCQSQPLYRRALAIREKALGPEHPETSTSLNNLAQLYQAMGDYIKAEPLLRRVLAIREKTLGPEHPLTATSFNNLAGLYDLMSDYPRAEALYRRALEIREKALGPEHPGTATSLNNLAELYKAMDEFAKAEPLLQRALAIREKTFGAEHPETATSLNNLAGLYRSMGDYAKAEPLLRSALAICEKTLGSEHPLTARSLSNLAILNMDLGKIGAALELAVRAGKVQEIQLDNILSFTSEQQRLAFRETTDPFALAATLGSAPDIAQAVLHNKGVVLDSLLEDRLVAETSNDAEQRGVIDQLRAAKQRYTQLLMEVPRDFSAEARQRREAELEKRAAQVEELEATLAQEVSGLGAARRALSVNLAQVQGALAGEQVLIELLRYNHYLGKNKWEKRYGALVIASKNEPRWVPLGAALAIEKKVNLYGKSVHGDTDETTLHAVLRTLYDQVWAPIEKALPEDTKTLILSRTATSISFPLRYC